MLYNEQGFITETTIANILYKFKNENIWHTPPITDGLLPGLERCKQLCDGNCKERSLSLDELKLTLEVCLRFIILFDMVFLFSYNLD